MFVQRKEKEKAAEDREFGPAQGVGQTTGGADKKDSKGGRAGNPIGVEAATGTVVTNNTTPDLYQIIGYMPKRGDFDQEYDGDADTLLADLEYFDDDTEQDIKLKNDVIDLYNARIDERIRRKKFVLERGILDFKKTQKLERKKTKEEREIINSMKIFARFNTAEDHERLVNNLLKERMLREVIEQLRYFKGKGLTNLDQIEKFIE